MANLILGTATFGTGYGVANKGIKLENKEVREIVATAQSLGINEFDTAPAYGVAEAQLGALLNQGSEPKVSSKISKENTNSVKLMLSSVKETLIRVRTSKLENLYLHDPEALSGPRASETIAGLKELIALGLVNRVGVSVYSLRSLLQAKELFPELTVFQVPENICDRRMLNSRNLVELKSQGNQFIVRSIFLQGLLLMSPEEMPPKLEGARSAVLQLRAFADSNQISILGICLSYGQIIPWASGLVIGAVSASQLREIIESKIKLPGEWDSKIDALPEEILDPRKW